MWLLSKRLEKGTFSWPKIMDPQTAKLRLAPAARSAFSFSNEGEALVPFLKVPERTLTLVRDCFVQIQEHVSHRCPRSEFAFINVSGFWQLADLDQ